MLIGAMKHLYIGGGASGLIVLVGVVQEAPGVLALLLISVPWTLAGLAYWRAHSFRRLAATKEVGGIGFVSEVKASRIFWTYVGGYILVGLSLLAGIIALGALFGIILASGFGIQGALTDLQTGGIDEKVPLWAITAFGIIGYFGMFLFWGAAKYTFVTMPIVACFAKTLRLTNASSLKEINQRERDEFAEAEGFADALDVGAAL